MNNIIRSLFGVSLLAMLAMPVFADFVTIAESYELEPQHVNVPVAPDSLMHFSECDGCATQSAQLTPDTLFRVEGETVNFEDFCKAILQAQALDKSGIVLQRHLETNDVVFVYVSL